MKRLFVVFVVAAFILAVPATHLLWGKAHVPAHKVQVCHKGTVINVGARAEAAHLNHGDCLVPIDDVLCIYFVGEACACPAVCPHGPNA